MSRAHRSPTRSSALATPLYCPSPRGWRAAKGSRLHRARRVGGCATLLGHERLRASGNRGRFHEEKRQRVAIRVVDVARVHEAEVLCGPRLHTAGGETTGHDVIDGLAAVERE